MRVLSTRRGTVVLMAIVCLFGCEAYEPRPLNESTVREEFLARTPESLDFVRWVRRLELPEDSAQTFEPADGLSAKEAEAVALFYNPELRRMRAAMQASVAGLGHAGIAQDPIFGLDAERIVENVEDPWIVGGTIGLVLPISGRLGVERLLASRKIEAELVRVLVREWEVRCSVRAAWLRWSADDLRVQALGEHLGRLRDISTTVARLESAGELPRVETRLFALEQAARRHELLVVEQRRDRASHELRGWLGLSTRASLQFQPSLWYPEPTLDEAQRLELAEKQNLDLRSARAAYAVSEEALHLEVKKQIPDLVLSPGAASDEGIWRALLGVSWPLPLWNGNRLALAEARAMREALRTNFAATLEELHGRMAVAERTMASTSIARQDVESNLLPLTHLQYEEARKAANLGQFDAVLLIDSLGRLQDAQEQWIAATLARAEAALEILRLQGPQNPPASPFPTSFESESP